MAFARLNEINVTRRHSRRVISIVRLHSRENAMQERDFPPESKSERPAPLSPARKGSASRKWQWIFGIIGFIIGCETHVQQAVAGAPGTQILLTIAGVLAGKAVGRMVR